MRFVSVALLTLACAGGAAEWRPTPQAGDYESLVVGRQYWTSMNNVPEGYKRLGDPVAGAWYILLSAGGQYCPVTPEAFMMARDNTLFSCHWRTVR